MLKSNPNWLRDYVRNHIVNSSTGDSADNVSDFLRPPHSPKNPGTAVLDLVYEAAELIEDVDNYAAERQAHAETLAQQAIDNLNAAKDRVRAAESARLAAEAEIQEFTNQAEKKFSIKIQELEMEMEQTASRMAAAEAQLCAAEKRAETAEMRANEAESSLMRIEEALRTQILDKRLINRRRPPTAA